MDCFDLKIIYFHISMSAFPGNLLFLAQGFFGSADAVSNSEALGFATPVQHVDLPLKA